MSSPRRRALAVWILPVLVMGLAGVVTAAQAAPSAAIQRRAKNMSDKAAHLFAIKAYLQAAELFEQSYSLDPDKLVRLRNAGRAFEEAGRDDRALHCFLRYTELEQDPKLLADASERIDRIKRAQRAARQARIAPTPTRPGAGPPGAGPPADGPPAAGQPADGPPAAAAEADPHAEGPGASAVHDAPGAELAAANGGAMPWVVGGAGVAVLATGVVWLLMTEAAADTLDEDDAAGLYNYADGANERDSDKAVIDRNRIVSWSLVGAGAVAVGAATWLALRSDEATAALHIDPLRRRVGVAWRF